MQPCEDWPELEPGGSELDNHIENSEAYGRCYDKHRSLVDWVDANH